MSLKKPTRADENKKQTHFVPPRPQKNLIAGWLYEECLEFLKQTKKFPISKNEKEVVLDAVYKKIQERNIWIPFIEIKLYFSKKQMKLRNRINLVSNG